MENIIGELVLFFIMIITIIAGTKSRQNLFDRWTAKKKGLDVPTRDAWTWVFSFLIPVFLLGLVFWLFDYMSK